MPPISGAIPDRLLTQLPIPHGIRDYLINTTNAHQLRCLWINESNSSDLLLPTGYPTRLCIVGSRLNSSLLTTQYTALLDELLLRVCSSVPIAVQRNLSRTKLAELVMNHYESRFQIERLVSEVSSSSEQRSQEHTSELQSLRH